MTVSGTLEPMATIHALRAPEDRTVHPAVAAAIDVIYRRYDEPLTLSDLAREVFISPFHLCRLFVRGTGVTPGRYLTSVRLFEAKRLLLSSTLTVSDVVCAVGYSSVGTFTTRFTRAVGMTPSQYRDPRVSDLMVAISPHYHRLPSLERLRDVGRGCGGVRADGATVAARVEMPADLPPGNLLVGVFADPIPQCAPVAFTGMPLARSGEVVLDGVPAGRWVVMAAAEHETPEGYVLSFGTVSHPVTITGTESVGVRLRVRRVHPTDPPIAISLARIDGSATPEGPRTAARALRAA